MLPALALVLLQSQTAPQTTQTPKRPQVTAPAGPPATAEQLKAWDGWRLGPIAAWPTRPAPFDAPIPNLRDDDPTATPFKLRVVVLTKTDVGADGERASILPKGVERLRAALRNVQAIVRETSGGRLDLVAAVSIEEDAFEIAAPETSDTVEEYLRPRINGGVFDAEDGVDRGPYSGVLVVAPTDLGLRRSVSRTPVRTMNFYDGGESSGTELERSLLIATNALIFDRLREGGVASSDEPAPTGTNPWGDDAWIGSDRLPLLRAGMDRSGATLERAAGSVLRYPAPPQGTATLPYQAPSALYVESDPARGNVLRYREPGEVRLGGFDLPTGTPPAGKNLAMWVKVAGREGIALRFGFGTNPAETILGPVEDETGVALPLDGAWHRVVVTIPANVAAISVGPPLARVGRVRRDIQLANVWFDDLEWTDDAPTPTVDGPSAATARALAGNGPLDLAAALNDPTPRLRARALDRVTNDEAGRASEPRVTALAGDIIPVVARAAVRALGRLGTPTALAAIRHIVSVGPTETARQQAARELAAKPDPADITTIAILLGRASWRTRLAGVQALGAFRQENAVRFRLSATLQEIPELRYNAIYPATAENADERQKLLYAAINDPSDAIRAFASARLLSSPNESDVAEGLRAASDDSAYVRYLFMETLYAQKKPAYRPLLLKGLVDPVAPVRAQALLALGELGPIDAAEVGAILNDPHPDVLRALIQLSKAGKLTLPDTARANIAASKNADVVRERG